MTPNKTTTHLFHAARLLAALLLLAGTAAASPILVPTGVDNSRGMNLSLSEDGHVNNYFAGVVYISVTQNGQQSDRDALCADLFTDIHIDGQYFTQILSPGQVSGRDLARVSWLVENALAPMQLTRPAGSALDPSDWIASKAQGAGAQLAIWDIVHDGGDGFSAGRVRAAVSTDPTVLYWANRYETFSKGMSSDLAFVYSNTDARGCTAQMLVGPAPGPTNPDSPAPEPAAFLLVGAGLVAGSFAVRRTRSGR
jgi:hypothetical protein